MMSRLRLMFAFVLVLVTPCCAMSSILGRNGRALVHAPARLAHRITQPVRAEARLAVLWIGHASTLIQLDDKQVLTDPVLTETVGQVARRLVEPGIDPKLLPRIDAAVVSHMHFDHLSLGSLSLIEDRLGFLVVPRQGTLYVPDYRFETVEVPLFTTFERGGLRVTSVPVTHSGFRYGFDSGWMNSSYTGYVIEYHGMGVYFGGDTAYSKERFQSTRARFPQLDVAILPIAPIHPRSLMASRHLDPREAVMAFRDLGARWMVPMHHGTFVNSTDAPGEPVEILRREALAQGVADQVAVLGIGEQRVLIGR